MAKRMLLTREDKIYDINQALRNKIILHLKDNDNWRDIAAHYRNRKNDKLVFDGLMIRRYEHTGKGAENLLTKLQYDDRNLGFVVNLFEESNLCSISGLIKREAFGEVDNDDFVLASQFEALNLSADQRFTSQQLRSITNNFDESPLNDSGRLIGSGGFSDVFFGIIPVSETSSGIKVAVKKFRSEEDPVKNFETFETESSMTRLEHPNLLKLFGFCDEACLKCLVYEYCSNGSLADSLHGHSLNLLSVPVRLCIASGVAEGIVYIHSENLIHRDIKSANILLTECNQAKIGDFGFVRKGPRDGVGTKTSTVSGTELYIAPEVYEGHLSPKADVYSFGMVLLEILTGLPLHQERNGYTNLARMIRQSEEPIMSLVDANAEIWNENLVHGLKEIALKCIHFDIEDRCSMNEAKNHLENLQKDTSSA